MLGYDMNTRNLDELEAAKQALIQQKPLVLAYVGDGCQGQNDCGRSGFGCSLVGRCGLYEMGKPGSGVRPARRGKQSWFDAMVIPKTSKKKAEAELFINFMCEPEIAFKNADYIGCSSPHTEVVKMLDPDLVADKAAYPDDEDLVNYDIF